MIILNGKKVQEQLFLDQQKKFRGFSENPVLIIVSVGRNEESEIYIKHKIKYGEVLGVDVQRLKLPAGISFSELKEEIERLNNDEKVSGIIIQLPAGNFKAEDLIVLIDPRKDVDGFNDGFVEPATARGVAKLLDFYKIKIRDKKAVVLGKSLIIGKPIAEFLKKVGAEVKVFNKESENIKEETRKADILVFATGAVKFFDCSYVGENLPIVIDVGISRCADGKIYGDTNFNSCLDKISVMTPVPGGVGPMTVWALFENLYELITQH